MIIIRDILSARNFKSVLKNVECRLLAESVKAVGTSRRKRLMQENQTKLSVGHGGAELKHVTFEAGAKKMSEKLNTLRSAKDFFFPQTENLVDFKVKGKEIEIIDPRTEHEDFVIFGVRACDARSFTVLDKVFLADPVDSYYKSRREHGTIVTLACTHPEETCFCSVFGIDPAQPEGDARCWMDEKNLYIEAVTEKGEAFVASVKDQLAEGGEEEVAAQQKATRAVVEKLPLHKLSLEGFGGENMLKLFNSDKWAGLSQSCLGCGTCTWPNCGFGHC